jgi:hypothetical protein
MMPPWFADFLDEVRTGLDPALAVGFDLAFRAVQDEGVTNKHARSFLKMVGWIVSQPRTLAERLDALGKLLALPRTGPRIVNLKQLTGW